MGYLEIFKENRGGFNFENCQRNENITKVNPELKNEFSFLKTGTTICGVRCIDGIVLAADTRATAGTIVADKNCFKLHHVTDKIFCAGAGTAADLDHQVNLMESKITLHSLQTNREARVNTVITMLSQHLFKYQGHLGCAIILGGVDITGPSLCMIYPHGSTSSLPYATMGSGSLAAMSVLETEYKDKMTVILYIYIYIYRYTSI
eukprot:GHVL01007025.1.p1 GENE.GHVL01007025.1~~GHVL01007025.1.p1  ORF type:complete len:205 (+),score=37.45 GHVL01007025.1:97-711(+)